MGSRPSFRLPRPPLGNLWIVLLVVLAAAVSKVDDEAIRMFAAGFGGILIYYVGHMDGRRSLALDLLGNRGNERPADTNTQHGA